MLPKQRFHAPDGYTPKVYGYGRVSHKTQFDKGDSLESQEHRCRTYFETRKDLEEGTAWGPAEWAGFYGEEKAQSAYTKDFGRRPVGQKLLRKLEPSDHLVVDKLDRLYRDFVDFGMQTRWFAEHGIRLHIVSMWGMSFYSDSPAGFLVLGNAALLAQMESMIKSQNIRQAREALRKKGLHDGTPHGWYLKFIPGPSGKTRGGGGHLEWRPGVRQMMQRIVAEIDIGGKSSHELAKELDLEFLGPKGKVGYWDGDKVLKFYWLERAMRYFKDPDINTFKKPELIGRYKQTEEGRRQVAIIQSRCNVWRKQHAGNQVQLQRGSEADNSGWGSVDELRGGRDRGEELPIPSPDATEGSG